MTPSNEKWATIHTDFLALGLGGTNMMSMLWSLAKGKSCVGVEVRGDPFLLIHWNIRVDLYHQLGLIDALMEEQYGAVRIPRRANGKPFKLAECFYSPHTTSGYVVADEVIDGHDKLHHIVGTIAHIEFIDDRVGRDGAPNRHVTVLPAPDIPDRPDSANIRARVLDILEGPSTFQSEANNLLILLRRYLEAVQELDERDGVPPRVRLFKSHRVKPGAGIARDAAGNVSFTIEQVQELDFKGRLHRVPASPPRELYIAAPPLVVVAQGVNSADAVALGLRQHDVAVDHGDGRGAVVAQADFLAGFIDVLVDGRLRRRIASAFDDAGREFWVRQIAVGHEGDPQVGWVLVQVPDFQTFDPVAAGLVSEGVERESAEYFAAHQRMLYDFYIAEASKVLEISETELRDVRMAYGPKLFSLVERIGEEARVARNVVVAGDSFGNGHFLTSGGAMTGMIGHSMAVMQFWDDVAGGVSEAEAMCSLAAAIKRGTQDWLEESAKEFSSFTPVNFGSDRVRQIATETNIKVDARAQSIDASRRKRHELQVQDPCDWRRPAMRNGKVWTAGLTPLDGKGGSD